MIRTIIIVNMKCSILALVSLCLAVKECAGSSCPENSIFKQITSACPATCEDVLAPYNCKLPPRQGCECQPGYVLSNEECIQFETCKCHTEDGKYITVNEVLESSDCVHVKKCLTINGKLQIINEQRTPCGQNAICKHVDDRHYKCVCKAGTRGNPHKICFDICPPGWKYFKYSCYRFSTDVQTWEDAQDKCKHDGAYLAEVESQNETDFLQGIAGTTGGGIGYWLGGKDDITEGKWYWANSAHPFAFTNWNPKEPNNAAGIEDCVHFYADTQNNWNDISCTYVQKYICEFRPVCPNGWHHFGKSCYKFSDGPEIWQIAQQKCNELGAYLAEVESQGETDFLQGKVGSLGYWLGGRDDINEGEWYWVNSGHPFDFTNWNQGEPNDGFGNEDCVHLWNSQPNNWNDFGCTYGQHYICEASFTNV